MLFVGLLIEAAEEVDGVEVLASAEFVGNPFAFLARVVEIEHGGDGVHAQAVDVVFVEPEHGARHEEAAHLGAAVVEDVRFPVGMESLARVGVFIKVCAVEVSESVRVGGEVRGHPVENHSDAVLVQVVDQVHEILRRAVAGSRREVSGGLVSPGTVERMLHHGQELNVREAQLANIFGEPRSSLAIGERTVVLFGDAHPGAEMDFVDGLRRAQGVASGAILHPVVIAPSIIEVPDD